MALHCPATLLLAPAPLDAKGVDDLVAALADERVLSVVRAPGVDIGQQVAAALDASVEDEPGLVDGSPTPAVLQEIADLHRGETVVVLTPGSAGHAPVTRVELGDVL